MLGIFVAELFREGKIAYFIVVLSLLVIIILLSCLKFLTKSKIFEKLWSFNKFFVVVLVSFMVGFGGFFLHTQGLMKENSIEFNSQDSYVVTGNLKNSAVIYNKEVTFFLDDVFVSGDGKAHKLEKGMYVKMAKNLDDDAKELQDAKMGDRISFVGSIFTSEVLGKGGVFMFAYKNDVRYIATTNTEKLQNITKEKRSQSFVDDVREKIKDTIYNNMEKREAGLCYAVFVGDLSGVDYDIVSSFQSTGVAHLLAVSGLNTALMSIVLVWILTRLGVKQKYSVLIVFLMLLFYCMICNFCASCLRASLMSVFLLASKAFGKQNDSINSTSLSGIVLLLFCPLFVFDLSFLLSYSCVFGMILLGPMFYRFFMRCKLGKFVSLNLSVSLAAQITTLCLCINTFGYVSVVSLLVNLIVCPIMEYVYIASFVSLMITLIMPFMGFLLWCTQWGYYLVDIITNFVASFSFASVSVDKLSGLFLVWTFLATYIFSPFMIEQNKRKRAIIYSGTIFVGVLLLCFSFL